MPKMGESIVEATILKWLKKEGEAISLEESVLEIATDKVDSEVPSPVEGTLQKILFQEGDVVEVGKVIALIETVGASQSASPANEPVVHEEKPEPVIVKEAVSPVQTSTIEVVKSVPVLSNGGEGRFYSPLVLNIARQEGIAMTELESIAGTGKEGRVTKNDILAYLGQRGNGPVASPASHNVPTVAASTQVEKQAPAVNVGRGDKVVPMDRMRKLIAEHMVMSKTVSPHVTSFVEADVTNMVNWRNRVKGPFKEREGENITFTPLFVEAVARAIKDFPGVNVSVNGTDIIFKKDINIGIAAALPNGNLIVPVVKHADQLNLVGITRETNRLVRAARNNALKPDDIQGGTFTLTNVGTFGNLSGTPIINQPQVAILATGAIIKKPAVLETIDGDVIGIRRMMMMSLSYDHRVVDGFLGGSFLRRVADNLEQFDDTQVV